MDVPTKVLIIEDDKELNEALSVKLGKEGFEVISAYDGKEGLEKAESERPDSVILDIVMPGDDGITVLQKIRESEWGESTPVLMLTNSENMEHIAKALEHESNDYIIKSETSLDEIVLRLKERLHI